MRTVAHNICTNDSREILSEDDRRFQFQAEGKNSIKNPTPGS